MLENIDFRQEEAVHPHPRFLMNEIRMKLHKRKFEKVNVELLPGLLDTLMDYYDPKSAYQIFSQYLQHLIYYIGHNLKAVGEEFVVGLVQHPYIFCALWVDPQQKFNALNSTSKNGYYLAVAFLIEEARKFYNGYCTSGFRQFITNQDKHGFSPLNTASKEGHVDIVSFLLNIGKLAFPDKEDFQKFVDSKNYQGFTPLNSACSGERFLPHKTEEFLTIARELVRYGANPAIKNRGKFLPSCNAPQEHKWDFVRNHPAFYQSLELIKRESLTPERKLPLVADNHAGFYGRRNAHGRMRHEPYVRSTTSGRRR